MLPKVIALEGSSNLIDQESKKMQAETLSDYPNKKSVIVGNTFYFHHSLSLHSSFVFFNRRHHFKARANTCLVLMEEE